MKFFLPFIFMFLVSCNKDEVHNIHINGAWTESQTHSENVELISLIEETLEKNPQALIELIQFNCGGASYCYDLGSVITQIIWKIGENDFVKMTNSLTSEQKNNLRNLIEVGLEYGQQLDPEVKNRTFEFQFPVLSKSI